MPAIGEIAPDFELQSDEGKPVRLSDYRGKKVILYFYPEDFTSGCELQACSFRDSYSDIEARNAVVLGVSPDSVDSHRKFREALNLPFNLLADPDFEVARAWNSIRADTSAEGSASTRTQRGQYVIDPDGKIIDVQTPVKATESRKLALEKL
jgi:thioredoxin-dependent peroxiredoxin